MANKNIRACIGNIIVIILGIIAYTAVSYIIGLAVIKLVMPYVDINETIRIITHILTILKNV